MSFDTLHALAVPTVPPAEQYQAAQQRCVWVDLSARTQIEVRGGDRIAFLHNFCTQEIRRLAVGSGAEAFVTNVKGRIVGHGLVFVGADAAWLDAAPGAAARLLPHLERYIITEDVQLTDRSAEWGEIALIGPEASTVVDRLLPGAGAWPEFRHAHSGDVTVRRFSFTRQPGWLVGAAPARLAELSGAWSQEGIPCCSEATFEALRIEAGFPLDGVDLSDEDLAHEAGRTRRAISFTKGCYLGQEPIARLEAMGHTNRELRRLRFHTTTPLPPGVRLREAGSGAELGEIRSSARLPAEQCVVALSMLRRDAWAPGTQVVAEAAEGAVTGVVDDWN